MIKTFIFPGRHKRVAHPVLAILLPGFAILLVILLYANTLHVPFMLDDLPNIEDNPHIRLTNLTLEGLSRAAFKSHLPYRPAANISFALNYYFHQYAVPGYHWLNLIIHTMSGLFLFLFVKTTLNLPAVKDRYAPYRWLPYVTLLIWLIHPLQTQSVTYIVQRMNSMAALFYMASMFLYARARLAEGRWTRVALGGGCLLAGLLALGSKEIAATLPLFLLLYEWYFFQDLSRRWLQRNAFVLATPLLLFATLAWLYLGSSPLETILNTYTERDFTLTERVLTEFRVVLFYFSLLLFPHPARLNLDHDFPLSHSLLEPLTTLMAMGTVLGLVGLAIYLARRERLISFCILWMLGNLVIESSVIGLEIVFEHRMYLPSMLTVLMIVDLARRVIRSRASGMVLLCGVVLVLSWWTYERNRVWGDPVTLWRDCVAKSPDKPRTNYNLGMALVDQGRLDEALEQFQKTTVIAPSFSQAYNNMGNIYDSRKEIKPATREWQRAIKADPDNPMPYFNLGLALRNKGDFAAALSYFEQYMTRADPPNPRATYYINELRRLIQL